jgi:hypothetical protein
VPPASAPVPGGPAAIRRAAHDIVSRPEFRPTPKTPIERLRTWAYHQLGRLINDVITAGPHGIIGALLALILVAGLVIIIVRAVRATSTNPVRAGLAVNGPRRTPADWLAEVARCEAVGDWRGALRSRYRGLVAELARRGLLEEIPGRTTGEYRRAVDANLPNRSDDFGDATELFEHAWYGDEPTDAPASARFRALAERVLEGAR